MSLFSILQLSLGFSLALANPDQAHQPVTAEESKDASKGSPDRAHQPYETPDQIPQGDATQPTESAPQETVIPEYQREVPEGQY